MINSIHGVFGGVFKIWGLILKFWKASVLACDQQINRSEPLAVGKVFQNMRINPHFLKNFFFFFCKESALYIHAYELKCELLLVLVMMTFSEWVTDWSGMVKIWNCTVEKASRQVPGDKYLALVPIFPALVSPGSCPPGTWLKRATVTCPIHNHNVTAMFYWHLSLTCCWEVEPDSFCKILVRQAHNIQNCDEAKQYSIQFCSQDDISNFFRFSMIYLRLRGRRGRKVQRTRPSHLLK